MKYYFRQLIIIFWKFSEFLNSLTKVSWFIRSKMTLMFFGATFGLSTWKACSHLKSPTDLLLMMTYHSTASLP